MSCVFAFAFFLFISQWPQTIVIWLCLLVCIYICVAYAMWRTSCSCHATVKKMPFLFTFLSFHDELSVFISALLCISFYVGPFEFIILYTNSTVFACHFNLSFGRSGRVFLFVPVTMGNTPFAYHYDENHTNATKIVRVCLLLLFARFHFHDKLFVAIWIVLPFAVAFANPSCVLVCKYFVMIILAKEWERHEKKAIKVKHALILAVQHRLIYKATSVQKTVALIQK